MSSYSISQRQPNRFLPRLRNASTYSESPRIATPTNRFQYEIPIPRISGIKTLIPKSLSSDLPPPTSTGADANTRTTRTAKIVFDLRGHLHHRPLAPPVQIGGLPPASPPPY
ncbi:hypothetical protein M5K25_002110 [Dendrobium thyrsiflorum]|uniref:Uncharacterized protein n=1 Tax=Dendrobium thyrsiflorum TaxID=117978 RepID=A0ABD0VTI3_DENTH